MTTDMGSMNGYPMPGSIQDINDHPEMNIPPPGYSPDVEHSTKMAGDVLQFPSSKADVMPNTTAVKNMIGRRNGGGGGNVKPMK